MLLTIPMILEERFKQKCKELKKRVLEVEESNEIATIALSRTLASIRRLRLEYSILLERLEDRAKQIPDGIVSFEEMACPPTPTILDDSLIKSKNGSKKGSKSKSKTTGSGSGSGSGANASGSGGSGGGSGNGSGGSPSDVASTTMGKQKARDPDLPKRPTNAYLIFCELEKERIKLGDPNASDISRSMTEAWRNLSEEDRRPYFKLYEEDRIRYQREMTEYHQRKEGGEPELKKQKIEQKEQPEETEQQQEEPQEGEPQAEEQEEEEEPQPEEALVVDTEPTEPVEVPASSPAPIVSEQETVPPTEIEVDTEVTSEPEVEPETEASATPAAAVVVAPTDTEAAINTETTEGSEAPQSESKDEPMN